jgi:hypothetical protein
MAETWYSSFVEPRDTVKQRTRTGILLYELLICFFLSACISNIIVIIFYLWVMIVFYIFLLLCLFWLVSMNNWNIFYDFMTHSISNGLWTDLYFDLFQFEINYDYNYPSLSVSEQCLQMRKFGVWNILNIVHVLCSSFIYVRFLFPTTA